MPSSDASQVITGIKVLVVEQTAFANPHKYVRGLSRSAQEMKALVLFRPCEFKFGIWLRAICKVVF